MTALTENKPTGLLSADEQTFLLKLAHGAWKLKGGLATPRIQSLIDRGYCRTHKERLGPLGVYTGDVFIGLSEAGFNSLPSEIRKLPKTTASA